MTIWCWSENNCWFHPTTHRKRTWLLSSSCRSDELEEKKLIREKLWKSCFQDKIFLSICGTFWWLLKNKSIRTKLLTVHSQLLCELILSHSLALAINLLYMNCNCLRFKNVLKIFFNSIQGIVQSSHIEGRNLNMSLYFSLALADAY